MEKKSLVYIRAGDLNPIPTGCCHVTLIYGLIPPMAGRNRVKCAARVYKKLILNNQSHPKFMNADEHLLFEFYPMNIIDSLI